MHSIWEKYFAEAHAVVFVVDGTDTEMLDKARLAYSMNTFPRLVVAIDTLEPWLSAQLLGFMIAVALTSAPSVIGIVCRLLWAHRVYILVAKDALMGTWLIYKPPPAQAVLKCDLHK